VIAVAASGQTKKELKLSTFLFLKWAKMAKNLHLTNVLPVSEYKHLIRETLNNQKSNIKKEISQKIEDFVV
jgi:hypothetical protein